MTTLIASGKAKNGTAHMELWRKEDYTYEIESSIYIGYPVGFRKSSELLEDTSYEVAIKKFEIMVDNVKLVCYTQINLESIPCGLSEMPRVAGGLILSLLWKDWLC